MQTAAELSPQAAVSQTIITTTTTKATSAPSGALIGATSLRPEHFECDFQKCKQVKGGELWMNHGVLIHNAEHHYKKTCCITAYQGRQHVLMPLDEIAHMDVIFATHRTPMLLIAAGLELVGGNVMLTWLRGARHMAHGP